MLYIKILNSNCNHVWSDWNLAGKRVWLHYQELNRYCKKCSKVERSFKDFFCPKKMKTGEFCSWCAQFEYLFLEQIDNGEVLYDNERMKRGRPENLKRNLKIVEMVNKGATYTQVTKKYKIKKATISAIIKRHREMAV